MTNRRISELTDTGKITGKTVFAIVNDTGTTSVNLRTNADVVRDYIFNEAGDSGTVAVWDTGGNAVAGPAVPGGANAGGRLVDTGSAQTISEKTIRAAAGTLASPGIAFQAQTGTGFHYDTGVGGIVASVGGAHVMHLESDKKIAFGEEAQGDTGVLAFASYQFNGPVGTVAGGMATSIYSNDTSSSLFAFTKSRSATKGTHGLVDSGDDIGEISFHGSDGGEYIKSAFLTVYTDAETSVGTVPMSFAFWNGPGGLGNQDIHLEIGSHGRTSIGDTVTPASNVRLLVESDISSEHTLLARQKQTNAAAIYANPDDASFGSVAIQAVANRTANSAFNLFQGWSGGFGDKEFQVSGDGNATCDGSFTGGGADYAEYFEWEDGNPNDEDRRGMSVVLSGNKIRLAQSNDPAPALLGVVSANPTVVGDAAWNKWSEKHLRDVFGSYIWEDYEVVRWEETRSFSRGNPGDATYRTGTKTESVSYPADEIPEGVTVPPDATTVVQQRRKVNPAYDPSTPYVPRAERKEWAAIGIMGKLRVLKGQPVGDRWIHMRAITAAVNEWLVR